MASGGSGSAKSSGDVGHLLVVIVDLCNAYGLSASSEDPTQAVRPVSLHFQAIDKHSTVDTHECFTVNSPHNNYISYSGKFSVSDLESVFSWSYFP